LENIENLKRSALATKQDKELNQYYEKYASQIQTMEINKALIEKYVENKQSSVEDVGEIDEISNENIEMEAESSHKCGYNPVSDMYNNK